MTPAQIKRTVAAVLRDRLGASWGLPMDEYKTIATTVETDTGVTGKVNLVVTFKRRTTGAKVIIENIVADATDGTVLQHDFWQLDD